MRKVLTFSLAVLLFLSALIIVPSERVSAASFDVDFEIKSKSVYLENLDTGTVVYSKEFDAIGLILSPKNIIDAIMRVPATSHRLFVETDDSIVLTSYYQEEEK